MDWTTDLQIPDEERIENKNIPYDDDDPTELNARWIMRIVDKIIDGKYRFRVPQMTYNEIIALESKKEGEIFFATDIKQFVGWNGTELITIG